MLANAGFHASKNMTIPENIEFIRIPVYTPELNPAEKVWQRMKERVAMKFSERKFVKRAFFLFRKNFF